MRPETVDTSFPTMRYRWWKALVWPSVTEAAACRRRGASPRQFAWVSREARLLTRSVALRWQSTTMDTEHILRLCRDQTTDGSAPSVLLDVGRIEVLSIH